MRFIGLLVSAGHLLDRVVAAGPGRLDTDRVLIDLASAGFVVLIVVLLVVTVLDSTAVPWPLRFAPLPGVPLAAAGSLLDMAVLVVVGLGLINVGLGAQMWWDRVLAGARQDGKGRHSVRRRRS